jgi:hypothetical protein
LPPGGTAFTFTIHLAAESGQTKANFMFTRRHLPLASIAGATAGGLALWGASAWSRGAATKAATDISI